VISTNLNRCLKIGNIGVKSLLEVLKRTPTLENVLMIFNGCPTINDQGLKGFDEDFVEMKELKRVVFTFAG